MTTEPDRAAFIDCVPDAQREPLNAAQIKD
jgi:hypothetical protein